MLVVMKKLDQFDEGTSILAWCRAIVRLEVLRAKQGAPAATNARRASSGRCR